VPPAPAAAQIPATAPPPPEPVTREPAAIPRPEPASAPDNSAGRGRADNVSPPPAAEDDDEAIRRVVATYAHAIETKDLALFRQVKPNLSAAEQRRIQEGFRNVSSQQVAITILSIVHRGTDATVRLRRRDTIVAAGRQQTTESQQTLTLTRTATAWVIREIG